jgi:MFS family permease
VPRSTAPDLSERRRVRLIVAGLALGWAVLYLDRSILFPLLPAIGDEFHLTGTQRGAITSCYFITYVVMQIPAGVLGDRLGLKRVLTGMYLLIGLGLLGIGVFSVSYLALLVFVAVQGFGAGAFYSGSYGITITTVPPERRGISAAVVTAGMALGSSLGVGTAGLLYAVADSWRAPFLFMLIPTLLMALVLATVIKGVPRAPRIPGGFGYLVRNRDMVALGIANFCFLYAYMVVLTWSPSFLVEKHGLSVARAGLYVSVLGGTSLLGALIWGQLSDRLGRKPLTLAMLGLSAALVTMIARAGSPGMVLVFLGAFGLFGALAWNPVFVAWVGDHTAASGRVGMGTVMGVMNTVGISSAFVAPVVSGWISDVSGSLSWAFYLGAFTQLGGILAALLSRGRVAGMVGRTSRKAEGSAGRHVVPPE